MAKQVAGHELKGLKAYYSTADSELHFPLMALIDYKVGLCEEISLKCSSILMSLLVVRVAQHSPCAML